MGLSKIWVFAESFDGKVSPTTLELLTKARDLADTVECVYGGADAEAIAAELGSYGATTVHATGDLGGALAGVPVASAIAARSPAGRRLTPSSSPPATTAVTWPAACRSSSTSRSSPTSSTSRPTVTRWSAPSPSSAARPM